MKFNVFLCLLFCFCFLACEQTTTKSTSAPTPKPEPKSVVVKESTYTVGLDFLRLREAPGEEGKELAQLTKGTLLHGLGAMSDFSTKVRLRGIDYDEPWIKVKTAEGLEGWVYAAGLIFDEEGNIPKILLEKRLTNIFGAPIAQQLANYQKAYREAMTSEAFALVYTQGRSLRDTLVQLLEQKIEVEDYDRLPDLFWLELAMPGFVTALVAEGTLYYLFIDFKKMQSKTKETSGLADDEFVELGFQTYGMDSIEYFFPAWFTQTWDYGGHSLLGEGNHFSILKTMSTLIEKGSPFRSEIDLLKAPMFNDMIGKEVSYWRSKDEIVKEMKQIIEGNLTVLTKEEILVLQSRLKQFKAPKANKIEVNLRSGF